MSTADESRKLDDTPDGYMVLGKDGWQRVDGKPLDEYDKRIAAGEDALKVMLERSRAIRARRLADEAPAKAKAEGQ